MAVTFDQFFNAIAGQESGGNYKAVNARTGAAGKYQIMPQNVAAWTKQYLGKSMSVQAFLADPAAQDAVARAQLNRYWNQYGDRGAAAAWYSGNPKNANSYKRSRGNEPSVGEYVDQVLARAGGSTGTPGTGATQGPIPTTVVDQTVQDSAVQQTQQSTGDPFALMTASVSAGTTAPGTESGAQAPRFDAVSSTAQAQQQLKQAMTSFQVPTEGAYNLAAGVGDGTATGKRAAIIALGKQYLGTMYKWGGAAPGGFDCSGLLQYIFGKNGITLPRVSYQQANAGRRVGVGDLQPGDLVAWDNSPRNAGADHIALYLGGGQILEAPRSGVPVRIRALGKSDAKAWGVQMNY